jgi:hypothetical protein
VFSGMSVACHDPDFDLTEGLIRWLELCVSIQMI